MVKKEQILTYVENSKLRNIIEQNHFVFDKGTLYCVRETCIGCSHRDGCKFDEVNELEETLNKSTRYNVKFGKIINKTDWYLPAIIKADDFKYVYRVNGRYIPKIDLKEVPISIKKRLVLSESFQNMYKRLIKIKGISSYKNMNDYILYNPEDEAYYCLKNSCYNCELKNRCEMELIQRDREMLYVAIDSASQEPEVVTYLSQEPQYVQIFINHSLTGIDYLLEPLNELFELKYNIDIEHNTEYHTFVDYLAFEDKTLLYNYCTAYYTNIKSIDIELLEANTEPIIAKYREFKELVKKGKIYIK